MRVVVLATNEVIDVVPSSKDGRMAFRKVGTGEVFDWRELKPDRAAAGAESGSINVMSFRVSPTVSGEIQTKGEYE